MFPGSRRCRNQTRACVLESGTAVPAARRGIVGGRSRTVDARRLDAPRHRGDRSRVVEERVDRDVHAEDRAHLVEELRATQRIAAQHEEILVGIDPHHVERARPQSGERDFERRAHALRRDVGRAAGAALSNPTCCGNILRCTLPASLRGSASTNQSRRGARRAPSFARTRPIISAESSAQSGARTTAATSSSPSLGCGTANAAASRTPGSARSTASTSSGRDLFAAAIDDFIEAPDDVELAPIVDERGVAGPEPTVDERLPVELVVVEVAGEHLRSAHLDFAGFALRRRPPLVIDDPDFSRERRPDGAAAAL